MSEYYTVRGYACETCVAFATPLTPESAPPGAEYDTKRDVAVLRGQMTCDACERRACKVPMTLTWAAWSKLDY